MPTKGVRARNEGRGVWEEKSSRTEREEEQQKRGNKTETHENTEEGFAAFSRRAPLVRHARPSGLRFVRPSAHPSRMGVRKRKHHQRHLRTRLDNTIHKTGPFTHDLLCGERDCRAASASELSRMCPADRAHLPNRPESDVPGTGGGAEGCRGAAPHSGCAAIEGATICTCSRFSQPATLEPGESRFPWCWPRFSARFASSRGCILRASFPRSHAQAARALGRQGGRRSHPSELSVHDARHHDKQKLPMHVRPDEDGACKHEQRHIASKHTCTVRTPRPRISMRVEWLT